MQRINRKYYAILFFVISSLWTWGCAPSGRNENIVAKVGDAVLTQNDLKARMEWEGIAKDRAEEYIKRWIDQELLYQEAQRSGLAKDKALDYALENFKKQWMIQKLVEKTFAEKIRISQAEIKDYYEKNKSQFQVQEDEVHLLHLLTKSQADAEIALREIQAGRPFDQVARNRSADAFREKGGDMGFVPRSGLAPEIGRIAFSLPIGNVSSVIKTSYGYHIIKVLERRTKGDVRPLKEVENIILPRIRVDKERATYYDLLYQLKDKYKVYVTENLKE